MGLGSTAKKLQTVADKAEQLYAQMKDVRERLVGLEETTDETAERVRTLETELTQTRAVVDALAEREGIDVEAVAADAIIDEADEESGDADTDGTTEGQ